MPRPPRRRLASRARVSHHSRPLSTCSTPLSIETRALVCPCLARRHLCLAPRHARRPCKAPCATLSLAAIAAARGCGPVCAPRCAAAAAMPAAASDARPRACLVHGHRITCRTSRARAWRCTRVHRMHLSSVSCVTHMEMYRVRPCLRSSDASGVPSEGRLSSSVYACATTSHPHPLARRPSRCPPAWSLPRVSPAPPSEPSRPARVRRAGPCRRRHPSRPSPAPAHSSQRAWRKSCRPSTGASRHTSGVSPRVRPATAPAPDLHQSPISNAPAA